MPRLEPSRRRARPAPRAVGALLLLALAAGLPSAPAWGQVSAPAADPDEPKTPRQLWEEADELIRDAQYRDAAAVLDELLRSNPDDTDWIAIRDNYGLSAILNLGKFDATQPYADPIYTRVRNALQRRETAGIPRVQAPGPELFAVEPRTPLEQWDAIDYLYRTDQAEAARPYLEAFLKANPDDATLLSIRDRFGFGSILRLGDNPASAGLVGPLLDRIGNAARARSADPGRIEPAVDLLTRSPEEQAYGVDRLRQSGAAAVPPILRRLADPSTSDEDRALLVAGLGRLDQAAVPPLIAALQAPNARLVADAADALARLGDSRAIPDLVIAAERPDADPTAAEAARRAVARLGRRPYEQQVPDPADLLAEQARRYQRHQVRFPADPVALWNWTDAGVSPENLGAWEAEGRLGRRFAAEALRIAPENRKARVAQVALGLEKAAQRFGPAAVLEQDPDGSLAEANQAGADVLAEVVRTAIADGRADLVAVAAPTLARLAGHESLSLPGQGSPLVEALQAPDRRAQFAAAQALVELEPTRPFPGSSGVVPTLARFVSAGPQPRAVVIDGNPNRAALIAGSLRTLGYEPIGVASGREGFAQAAESADVELIVIEPSVLQGPWRWLDVVVNLRADARTADVPLMVVGPLGQNQRLQGNLADHPRTGTLVLTDDPLALGVQLNRELQRLGARPLSAAERQGYARAAAALLARVATTPESPYADALAAAEPALSLAALAPLDPDAGVSAATALADVPGSQAQQGLADLLLESVRPPALRLGAGESLARSLRRFGPLLTPRQERRLLDSSRTEPDPQVRAAILAVLEALRPEPQVVPTRPRAGDPLAVPNPRRAGLSTDPVPTDPALGDPAPMVLPPVGPGR